MKMNSEHFGCLASNLLNTDWHENRKKNEKEKGKEIS